VPIGQEAGWASELVWILRVEEKFFVSARNRTLVVQPVVRNYTDGQVINYTILERKKYIVELIQ
jgi:hypothetical protein